MHIYLGREGTARWRRSPSSTTTPRPKNSACTTEDENKSWRGWEALRRARIARSQELCDYPSHQIFVRSGTNMNTSKTRRARCCKNRAVLRPRWLQSSSATRSKNLVRNSNVQKEGRESFERPAAQRKQEHVLVHALISSNPLALHRTKRQQLPATPAETYLTRNSFRIVDSTSKTNILRADSGTQRPWLETETATATTDQLTRAHLVLRS